MLKVFFYKFSGLYDDNVMQRFFIFFGIHDVFISQCMVKFSGRLANLRNGIIRAFKFRKEKIV